MKRADLSSTCLRSPNRAHVRTRPRAAGIGRDKTEAAIVGEMHYPSNHLSPINSCKWMPVLWRLSILQICLFAVWMPAVSAQRGFLDRVQGGHPEPPIFRPADSKF